MPSIPAPMARSITTTAGLSCLHLDQGLLAGGGLGHHLNVGLRSQQGLEPAADHQMVVHQQHGDRGSSGPPPVGSCAATIVPSPGVLSTENTPPSCSTRCRMARSP